jgi:hypothetical protein
MAINRKTTSPYVPPTVGLRRRQFPYSRDETSDRGDGAFGELAEMGRKYTDYHLSPQATAP